MSTHQMGEMTVCFLTNGDLVGLLLPAEAMEELVVVKVAFHMHRRSAQCRVGCLPSRSSAT